MHHSILSLDDGYFFGLKYKKHKFTWVLFCNKQHLNKRLPLQLVLPFTVLYVSLCHSKSNMNDMNICVFILFLRRQGLEWLFMNYLVPILSIPYAWFLSQWSPLPDTPVHYGIEMSTCLLIVYFLKLFINHI